MNNVGFPGQGVVARYQATLWCRDREREHNSIGYTTGLQKSAAFVARSSEVPHLRSKSEPARPSLPGKTIRHSTVRCRRRAARKPCLLLDARRKSSLSLG